MTWSKLLSFVLSTVSFRTPRLPPHLFKTTMNLEYMQEVKHCVAFETPTPLERYNHWGTGGISIDHKNNEDKS